MDDLEQSEGIGSAVVGVGHLMNVVLQDYVDRVTLSFMK